MLRGLDIFMRYSRAHVKSANELAVFVIFMHVQYFFGWPYLASQVGQTKFSTLAVPRAISSFPQSERKSSLPLHKLSTFITTVTPWPTQRSHTRRFCVSCRFHRSTSLKKPNSTPAPKSAPNMVPPKLLAPLLRLPPLPPLPPPPYPLLKFVTLLLLLPPPPPPKLEPVPMLLSKSDPSTRSAMAFTPRASPDP